MIEFREETNIYILNKKKNNFNLKIKNKFFFLTQKVNINFITNSKLDKSLYTA